MIDIAVKTLLAILGVMLTGVVIPYINSKTTLAQREKALSLISAAVAAAEQAPALADAAGEDKKRFVLQWLADRDIVIDGDELDALIESAVYALKNG